MQTQEVRVLGFRVIELSCASRLSSHAPAADFESSLSLPSDSLAPASDTRAGVHACQRACAEDEACDRSVFAHLMTESSEVD